MTDREQSFKDAVLAVAARNEFPSGVRIHQQLGKVPRPHGILNGEETRWRREVLLDPRYLEDTGTLGDLMTETPRPQQVGETS